MRVMHITECIRPQNGGPPRSIKGICKALAEIGVETELFVHSPAHDFADAEPCRFVRGSGLSKVAVLKETAEQIETFRPDVINLHGLWMRWNHWDLSVAMRYGVPVVVSPRGALDPWALSVKKWKKRLAMWLYQRRDLKKIAAFHVTAELEKSHVEALRLQKPIFISPNGVTVPKALPKHQPRTEKTALFLSRLHPGKGLLTLVEAWKRVKPVGWRMRVVGPDVCGHKAEVVEALRDSGIEDQWDFINAVDDVEKWDEYRSADLLVHPSVSENFGITIAEGLYAGLPVIATRGAPWKDLEDYGCGWWIDVGVEPLADALREAIDMNDNNRMEMGAIGHNLVEDKYVWNAVAEKMRVGYEALIGMQRT